MSFTIRHLGQNCFDICMDRFKLLIDPYFSNSARGVVPGFEFNRQTPVFIKAEEIRADLVYCTHDHIDHLDPNTIPFIKNATFMGPSSCVEHFLKLGIVKERILQLNRNESTTIKGITLTSVYANHTDDSCGLVIEHKGKKLYNVGDSLYDEKLLALKDMGIDVILVPINGKLGNMGAEEAAKLSKELMVKVAVPCHFDMFLENSEDPEVFREYLKGSSVSYFSLELNKTYLMKAIIKQPNT